MREADYGVQTSGRLITDLRYADDTVIIINGERDPSEALKRVDDAGKIRGLKLNSKKTKCKSIGGRTTSISVNGDEIEPVRHFKYLGSIKSDNGD